jgi:acetylornithine deacetylase/succinyl-diaminopimelate desuccinylase-like protein
MTETGPTRHAIDRLWAEIDRREDELIETVAELVRRPSPLGAEAEAQSYVAEHLATSGLDVEVWDLDDTVKATSTSSRRSPSRPGRTIRGRRPSSATACTAAAPTT